MRASCLAAVAALALAFPAAAQEPASAALSQALAEVEGHRVNMRVGCSVPLPALWNAPPWEQRAAAHRRAGFEQCLSNAMYREQDRLQQLEQRIASLQAQDPNADWEQAGLALDRKWSELDSLSSKLRTRENWADTAIEILDTFTAPGAPFGPRQPYGAYSPYGAYGPYRPDTSTFRPGIR